MAAYFPLFVPLTGRKIAVFGGGKIALRRIKALLPFGGEIVVTAPECCPELEALGAAGEIALLRRPYCPGDTAGAGLVLAATDSREVNHRIGIEASAAGIPVSVADCQAECTFLFPGLAVEGELVAGVTSGGTDHSLVRKAAEEIRQCLQNL